ncbi:MAG: hypothetical protein M0R32_08450 [Candidatus Cloacimonetes bacterium]|jgi:hypothetical protein|nr:hypothetical protein [Candidatus Cloacimonadota bacterium]
MILTYKEIMDCGAWDRFCKLHGVNEWAVNEGGGDCQQILSVDQAYYLGILKNEPLYKKHFYEVYSIRKCHHCGEQAILHPCGDGFKLLCDKCLSSCIDM